ncbi:MAG: DNA cytosine methyltransferase [Candidatus Omnitrophica bacterium]|nr:DNA cytosine methyltransferase [Candidatus Omnitrophota bacterium]
MRILNLYPGIGGNRKLWQGNHSVTAIEKNIDIARIYQHIFPSDKVIVGDAHLYLLDYYQDFDFIWSSPPCQTHSALNMWRKKERPARYPDMTLYQEILLLKHFFKGKWIVENVRPYYTPLIPPTCSLGRHCVWCNFFIEDIDHDRAFYMTKSSISKLEALYNYDLSAYRIKNKRQLLRNCVDPKLGKHILDSALGIYKEPDLFEAMS